ncbi:MAG: hypothetical protein IPJ90_08775 [Anaerolineaceae bacterium]|nr:hypothetical protein [Anaerolineaceae bacterium]
MHHKLTLDLVAAGITRGRDAFFALLGRHGLLVKPRLSRRRTTRSGLWRCPNCLAGMTLTRPHQAWVETSPTLPLKGALSTWRC